MRHVFTNVLAKLLDPRPNPSIIFPDMSFQWGSDWQILLDNIVAGIYHVTRYSQIPRVPGIRPAQHSVLVLGMEAVSTL